MGLINNSIESLYNGVSEQSSEHRQPTQVKEMINAFPSIDKGLLRRNPTFHRYLSSSITYSSSMWIHAYDRGLSGDSEEKYAITVTTEGMEIINVNTGTVYKEGSGLTYDGLAKTYLYPFGGSNGYSATTVKDTTFIVNKNKVPTMSVYDSTSSSSSSQTIYTTTISLTHPYDPVLFLNRDKQAPYSWTGVTNGSAAPRPNSVTKTIIGLDGKTITIPHNVPNVDDNNGGLYIKELTGGGSKIHVSKSMLDGKEYYSDICSITFNEWKSNIASSIKSAFPSYSVRVDGDNIIIEKTGSAILLPYVDIKFYDINGDEISDFTTVYSHVTIPAPNYSTWVGSVVNSTRTGLITDVSSDYRDYGFIWIKGSNPTAAYDYSVTIADKSGYTAVFTSTGQTTTEAAASDLSTLINADTNFTSTVVGSVIKVVCANADLDYITSSDSYGNQAMFSWNTEVQFTTDLPASLGFDGAVVKVIGNSNASVGYWLKYTGGRWIETADPSEYTNIDPLSMPHILVRNSDDTFTLKSYDKWKNRLCGDSESNPPPSFISTVDNPTPTIRDIFFFKNRLGFITDRTVVMSEVGKYGNFWRTTTATLLDSDPIDTTVDTTKAIRLEYAAYLEDSVMLFSDKVQFKLEGGKILSPASVQISQTSAYTINKNVRPVYMNDKIFFCAYRGSNTAVMQYQVKSSNTSSEAIDITAHVQSYIPSSVTHLSGDAINNMLFLSVENSDTMYCYKYYDIGSDRVQSAWFKYSFNGIVYRGFSLGNNLNLLIRRNNSLIAENWVLGTGIWESDKIWDSSKLWISNPEDLVSQNQFEIMPITPLDYKVAIFRDVNNTSNSTLINTDVNFGEWVASIGGKKDIRGLLKFKSVMISSEANSDFELYVNDLHRGDTRIIESKYTVNRKPMVYGDARNIEVGVRSVSDTGFRINTVNYEGNYNSRSKKA